ncbi:MAG: flagellar basal body P-ring formation protein FlgA [Pyrinomonadaceae bacterium]|nr:flagellar basal body P-ring formation protein FlgA [Pyrinomonadaceae bacterium]
MKKTFLSFIFVFILALSAFPKAPPEVRIKAEARVENEIIMLGNIAHIKGNREDVKRIERISLGYAPKIGAVRDISRSRIELSIAAAGYSKTGYTLIAPPQIRISRLGQQLDPERFRESITKAILKRFEKVEVDFVRIDLPLPFDVPLGEVDLKPKFAGVRNFFAPFSVPIEIRVNKRLVQSISVDVEIEGHAEVFVANRDLRLNQRLQESDLRLERVRLEKPLNNYLRDPKDLCGMKLVKELSRGSVLTNDTFVADVVVKTGDLVRIVGRSDKLRIFVNGKAQGSGRIGDRISVKNLQSNTLLQAIVIDEGMVKVLL